MKNRRIKMHKKLILVTIFVVQLFHTIEATQSVDSLENSIIPDDVAKIVEAITQVQKNVTVNPSNVNNIKVATGAWTNISSLKSSSSDDDKDSDLMRPFVISPDARPIVTKIKPRPVVTNDINDIEDNLVETEEITYTSTNMNPPSVGIFSYEGVTEWFDWVVSMRDPKINPSGTSSWRSIIAQGMVSLAQQYNPFRSFFRRGLFGRSLDTNTFEKLTAVYNNRDTIVEKLSANIIQPDAQSILDYAVKLENERKDTDNIGITISDLSKGNVTPQLNIPALSTLVDVLNGQNVQIGKPGINVGVPAIDKPDASPTEVFLINSFLKWFYTLIPLAFLPFSGIENFFIAPLPPNLETVPGVLRLFGLQALLGPDYVLDYDAAYDPAYDTPEDEIIPSDDPLLAGPDAETTGGVPLSGDIDEFTDYDYETRRRKGTTATKKYKIKNTYAPMDQKMKPPPSRYGVSSYTSYKNKAAAE